MVGIGTALNDDPQLNTRHLPPLPSMHPHRYHLPRPIILDSNLRFPINCKLLKNYHDGRGRRPWLISSRPAAPSEKAAWTSRKQVLESAGARVIEVSGDDGHITISDMLSTLRQSGVRSLMVEGGASVIQSFMADASGSGTPHYVDTVIVTVAPLFVGAEGVSYGAAVTDLKTPAFHHLRTELVGRDAVVALGSSRRL
ncbi:hypothetical protein NM688_g3624 [Phlebia brevispora]|uniref:Uncharacterized protein n=1 Tax=Phlebia brevispora TaxID=194682 RepID=A0ACC1T578_9APHY|nr:hypothetical protein NM688_g3624 [Phlebia brevispora]